MKPRIKYLFLFLDWCGLDPVHRGGRRPSDWIEDAVVGPDAVAAQVERPIHREKYAREHVRNRWITIPYGWSHTVGHVPIIDDIRLVIHPRLVSVERDDVNNLTDSEASTAIRPDDLVLVEARLPCHLCPEVTLGLSRY